MLHEWSPNRHPMVCQESQKFCFETSVCQVCISSHLHQRTAIPSMKRNNGTLWDGRKLRIYPTVLWEGLTHWVLHSTVPNYQWKETDWDYTNSSPFVTPCTYGSSHPTVPWIRSINVYKVNVQHCGGEHEQAANCSIEPWNIYTVTALEPTLISSGHKQVTYKN